MSTYVLVHGTWHGKWCWDKVVPLLRQAGHHVVAFDLPGHGQDTTPVSKTSLDLYVERTCEVLAAQMEPVILVGHSAGGLVISQAAERDPTKIEKLVYLTAYLFQDGEYLLQKVPIGADSPLVVDEAGTSVTMRADMLKDLLYADCSEDDIERAAPLLVPETITLGTAPVHVTSERFGQVPRVYIECLQDRTIIPALQKQMYTALPCQRVLTLDTSHSPFFSAPEALSELLLSV